MSLALCSAIDPGSVAELELLNERLQKYYNGVGTEDYFDTAERMNAVWSTHSEHTIIKKLCEPGMSICDMGCGSAHSFSNLKEKRVSFTGIDISEVQILRNRMRYGGEPKFYARSLYNTGMETGSFDFVFSTYVIEHLVWPHKFLHEVARLVKPCGLIVILCPHFRIRHRIPSLEYGTTPLPLRDRTAKMDLYGCMRHLWLRQVFYPTKIRATYPRKGVPFLINLEPSCFQGGYYVDNDAVYFTDRSEMVAELLKEGVVDVTETITSILGVKRRANSCMIVGKKMNNKGFQSAEV